METPKIDGFEILDKLGEGGMASVWKARQISLDRLVAIKILSPELAAAAEDVSRFQKEARSTAKLKHQGIVQVYDAKVSKDLYCFVMEYVAGYTVGEWIRRKGYLSESDALTVAECIADAMDYAWTSTKTVHCDIKPDNIIIDADGTVKVADLGLSYTINAISQEAQSEDVMGTPAYISPEQAEGRGDLDCRADIYSLGAMIYHMLTGKLMFQGESDDNVMRMQVSEEPVDAKELNSSISISANNLLKQMLKKDRSERPEDWAEVKKLLQQVRQEVTGKYGASGVMTVSSGLAGGLSRGEQSGAKYNKDRFGQPILVRTAILFAGFLLLTFLASRSCQRTPDKEEGFVSAVIPVVVPAIPATQQVEVVVEPKLPSVEDNAREMLEFAKKRQQGHPEDISTSIEDFRKVAAQTTGTKYSLMAEDEIRRLQDKLKAQVNMVMSQLDVQAKKLVDAGKLRAAADVYKSYDGKYQEETVDFRKNATELLLMQHVKRNKDIQRTRQKNNKLIKELINKLPSIILDEGLEAANELLQNTVNDPSLKGYVNKLNRLSSTLDSAVNIDQHVVASFRLQMGEEITVNTVQGNFTIVIISVDGHSIVGRRNINIGSGMASSEIVLDIDDLTVRERMSRMGSDDLDSVSLVKGVIAYNSKAYDHAKRFFENISDPVSEGLLLHVDMQLKAEKEQIASDNLRLLLSSFGVDVPVVFDKGTWKKAINNTVIDKEDIENLIRSLDSYMSEYGETDFAVLVTPMIERLKKNINRNSRRKTSTDEQSSIDERRAIKRAEFDFEWRKNR